MPVQLDAAHFARLVVRSKDLLDLPAFRVSARLARVRELVQSEPRSWLTSSEAAQAACWSTAHFCRQFRKYTGTTFKTWQEEVRIGWAIELLADAETSVREVAAAAGFRSLRTFQRTFSRVAGTSPQRCRDILIAFAIRATLDVVDDPGSPMHEASGTKESTDSCREFLEGLKAKEN